MRDELSRDIWYAYYNKLKTLKGFRKILFEMTRFRKVENYRNKIIKNYKKCIDCGGYFKTNIIRLKNGYMCWYCKQRQDKKIGNTEHETLSISLSGITCLVREGRITLQIPQFYIIETEEDAIKVEEEKKKYPKEYFCTISSNRVPSKNGFLYLTRAGYNFFKEDLKKAFEQALLEGKDRTEGRGWDLFEEEAEKHFQQVEKMVRGRISSLEKQVENLKKFVV